MKRTSLVLVMAGSMIFTAGCTTKKYVRQQTTPIIEKTNELDDLTAKNSNAIRDVDSRAQQGIQSVQAKAAEVDRKALAAGQQADQAQSLASDASNRVSSLSNTVANLDNYRPVVETSVQFGFNKDTLTSKAKAALDQLIAELPNAKHYIVAVEGGADSVGDKNYNYDLSERRASAVIQYLASMGNVPAHKIFLIGLGKDKPVAPNTTAAGRAKNRRVDVRLMTNTQEGNETALVAPSGNGALQPR
jgi:OmpA-OmpF porin, OOP family